MQQFGNVGANFRKAEWPERASAGHSLPERAQFWLMQHDQQFRLVAHNDLEELLLVGIRITQQANLFQKFWSQEMSFVHEEERCAALSLSFQKHPLECRETRWLARRRAGNFKFREDHLQEFFAAESWIENECRRNWMPGRSSFREDLQGRVNNRRLSSSNRTRHQEESLAAHDRLDEGGQRSCVRFRKMKEPGVRR